MEHIVLTDQSVKPDNDIVFSIIGDKSILWQTIMNYLHENHPDISEEWKFYNDGKSWLFRALKKERTIFWFGVQKDTFRVYFFLGHKADAAVEQSNLPENIKIDFKNSGKDKTTRSISIIMSDLKDVDSVIQLIEIKFKLK